jgi:hypothetical protein
MALTDPTTLHDFTSGADEDRRPYCGKCDELVASVDEHGWCADCVDNYDPTPDYLSDDSGPTLNEQCEAAWRLKRGLR